MQEKYRDKKKKSYICFVDIEKVFDGVPRKVMEWGMRTKGLPEVIVRAVISLYVVIQFPSGVVPSAEMAGFTPCMGIYWSEIFLQGACPCLPPTSVF